MEMPSAQGQGGSQLREGGQWQRPTCAANTGIALFARGKVHG